MNRRAAAGAIAGVLALGGCTGTSAPSPSSSAERPTGSPTVRTSTTASCSHSPTKVTFRRHEVVTSGVQVGLAPHSTVTSPRHLAADVVVRSAASGIGGATAALVDAVGRHWHTTVVAPGRTTAQLEPDARVTVANRSGRQEVVLVYRTTRVYTGTFVRSCGAAEVRGRYTTFGPIATTTADCTGGHPGALERAARRQFC